MYIKNNCIYINGVPQIIAALVKVIHYEQNDPNLTIYIPNLRKQIGIFVRKLGLFFYPQFAYFLHFCSQFVLAPICFYRKLG